jgi:hypothetical protein
MKHARHAPQLDSKQLNVLWDLKRMMHSLILWRLCSTLYDFRDVSAATLMSIRTLMLWHVQIQAEKTVSTSAQGTKEGTWVNLCSRVSRGLL